MCIALVAVSYVKKYPLILLSNRDEFFSRPTSVVHFWKDSPQVLGGRDELQGGTWLGITKKGKIALVTNVRDPSIPPTKKSRGEMVRTFLQQDMSIPQFSSFLRERGRDFNPFNLVFGAMEELYFASNYYGQLFPLEHGVHVISNGRFGEDWPKCRRLRELFFKVIKGMNSLDPDPFFEILGDETTFPDEDLPDTGVGLEMERFLSPIFIRGKNYGTRTSTVVIYNRERIDLWERTYEREGRISSQKNFSIFL